MIARKNTPKIVAAILALAVLLCLCAAAFSDSIAAAADTGVPMEYEQKLFDTGSILTVNIVMDEASWNDMLENATAEEYFACDVEINGTTFYRVGIRPKGNTSLSSIASDPTTDRYSFKLEFDHYVDGQTCFGLDKLILNNNYADATNMKEALIYDMYQYLGADASLYNYAKISVNGEYWGVYLALEAVEDSFLLRNYGAQTGALYKPDSMDMGGGDKAFGGGRDFEPQTIPDMQETDAQEGAPSFSGTPPDGFEFPQRPDDQTDEEAGTESQTDSAQRSQRDSDFPGGKGGFSMGLGGANLNYTDDELDSYETIWDGEVTDTKKADHKRVVTALKNISEGTDLETYMDIDNLLRYMAVHVFSVNEDSLSGSMAHNYYLYESGGRLNLIPWDYNLALGGMGGGNDAASVVNSAIDNAFSATAFFDTLMEDETYHSRYYAYLQQLVREYIEGGGFDAFYTRVRSQIDTLVETDPTAFYSYDEYLTAADTPYQVVKLRGQSIEGQLDGTIPSTEEEQRTSDALVDTSALDISAMGSMNTGGGFQNRERPEEDSDKTQSDAGSSDTAAEAANTPPAGFDQSQPEKAGGSSQSGDGNAPGAPPSMEDFPGGDPGGSGEASGAEPLLLYGASLLMFAAAMLFAVLYRRRPRR